MDKNPAVAYYPVTDKAPLSDYAPIGEETQFEVDGDGYLVITFPAVKIGVLFIKEHPY